MNQYHIGRLSRGYLAFSELDHVLFNAFIRGLDQIYRGYRLREKANTMGCWNQDTNRYRQLETGLRGVNVKSCTWRGA